MNLRTKILATLLTTWVLHVLTPVLHAVDQSAESERGHASCACSHHCPSAETPDEQAQPEWSRGPWPAHDSHDCALCATILKWTGAAEETVHIEVELLLRLGVRAEAITSADRPRERRARARAPPIVRASV